MSIRKQTSGIIELAGLAILMAACGGQPTPNVNAAVQTALAQTSVAQNSVAQAVAATLTASAPTATVAQTQPTDTPAVEAPTSTPVPTSTATAVQIEIIPLATPPPAPTATPVRIAISPVDGDDGNDFLRGSFDSNAGRNILLPGFDQSAVGTDPTFRDFINFRVEVFDTRAGLYDGAGIQDVSFRIIADDGNGDTVWEKTEVNAPYCVFGGDAPDCTPAIDLRPGAQWPTPFAGEVNNNVYLAEIDITPVDGDTTQWRWRFFIDSPQLQSATQPDTAPHQHCHRAGMVAYYVDFETYDFTPAVARPTRPLLLEHGAAPAGWHARQRTVAALSCQLGRHKHQPVYNVHGQRPSPRGNADLHSRRQQRPQRQPGHRELCRRVVNTAQEQAPGASTSGGLLFLLCSTGAAPSPGRTEPWAGYS